MEVVSICVGPVRTMDWQGARLDTGIFKSPVEAAEIGELGLRGDQQADLKAHGGPNKAVYAYSAEHYPWWKERLPGLELPHGIFGENLTLSGFDEEDVGLGDSFRAGTALLMAVQPRLPCAKLGLRFNDPGMVKRFAQSLRLGVYFRVAEPGRVRRGDAFTRESRDPRRISIPGLARLYFDPERTAEKTGPALDHPALDQNWRKMLGERPTRKEP